MGSQGHRRIEMPGRRKICAGCGKKGEGPRMLEIGWVGRDERCQGPRCSGLDHTGSLSSLLFPSL